MLAPVVSVLTASILLSVLTQRRNVPLDRPNERSLHAAPVPRVGGLAVVPAVAAGWACVPTAIPWTVWFLTIALCVLSFLDDMLDLPVLARLLAHLLAAIAVAGSLVLPAAGWLAAAIAVITIAWMTNLYNFMDGSDGLAGGMAIIGFSGYTIAALLGDEPAFAQACFAVAAASAVFLRYNFHPAKVFLGDSGSIPLGFLAAALGTQGWITGLWPAWFPLMVFSPFIVDASVTLLRRALRGEKIWRAHREHYYQRLVRLGWGHQRTALAAYLLMTSCSVIALAGLGQPAAIQGVLIGVCIMAYAVLMLLIDRAWRQHAQVP